MIVWYEILLRLVLASLFGAFIGLERERKDWAAGLRTHMLVCVGACLIMIVSAFGFSDILGTEHVELDPSRIAAQVVSGIGFIGAGTILFLKEGVIRGITTAAGLWTVAAIGLATGSGMYFAAGATTIIALIILWGLQQVEHLYFKKFRHMNLRVVASKEISPVEIVNNILDKENSKIQSFNIEKSSNGFIFQIKIDDMKIDRIDEIVSALQKEEGVKEVFWEQ